MSKAIIVKDASYPVSIYVHVIPVRERKELNMPSKDQQSELDEYMHGLGYSLETKEKDHRQVTRYTRRDAWYANISLQLAQLLMDYTKTQVEQAVIKELKTAEKLTHDGRGTILWEMDDLSTYLNSRIAELQKESGGDNE